jgi:Cys-tRNA synthase (O-phospho-L-seryl-tRNA:Cys-tRNA synthase)
LYACTVNAICLETILGALTNESYSIHRMGVSGDTLKVSKVIVMSHNVLAGKNGEQ